MDIDMSVKLIITMINEDIHRDISKEQYSDIRRQDCAYPKLVL